MACFLNEHLMIVELFVRPAPTFTSSSGCLTVKLPHYSLTEFGCVSVTVMKDGIGAVEQAEVSRQDLYEDYVNGYRQGSTEARVCCDARLLKKAAQYLLREPESRGTFTVFPFHQAVGEDSEALSTDGRSHLCAVIKATELLETLCVNLFLQPWKKEFKTLKTFTGPFVYRLLPVFRSSTIQSILASIGYLPHTDAPQSEFRLSEDADPDRAILVGFELLLARVQCYHLLERLERDQLGPQEWLEVLQRTVGPSKPEEPTEKKTTIEQKEKKKEEADKKEIPLYSDTRLAVKPHPRPRQCHVNSVDLSIIEMQRTYPDLAFRGRPLVPDKSHQSNSSPSLHITLRPGSKAEQGLKPGESQTTAGPPAWVQQQAAPGIQNKRPAQPEPFSPSTEDEEKDIRVLAERVAQLCVKEPKQELKGKGENTERGENKDRERWRKERKISIEGEADEQNFRKPVMETAPALSHDASRCTRSSQHDPVVMKEQKKATVCHPSALTDCQTCEGADVGQQEGQDPERAATVQGEEEQPAQSFVIVEHHRK